MIPSGLAVKRVFNTTARLESYNLTTMGVSVLIILTCLFFGAIAALMSMRPEFIDRVGASIKDVEKIQKFSPRNTLFIIGPSETHPTCKMQRRLLKPAIPALISEDITVFELYGEDTPRKNGDLLEWLDPSLLRHALSVDDGFYLIYVNQDGKTQLRSEAPMVTKDILARAGIKIRPSETLEPETTSSILKKLRAA